MTISEVIVKLMHVENVLEQIGGFDKNHPYADEFEDILDCVGECIDTLDANLEQYQKCEAEGMPNDD